MHYYVDGYNLLFSCLDTHQDLETKREKIINLLQNKIGPLNLEVTLVFDASRKNESLANFQYFEFLEAVFTMQGQTADEYILERISESLKPENITVVTDDRELSLRSRHLGAYTTSVKAFLKKITKMNEKKKKREMQESPKAFIDSEANIERLLKIFEERLKKSKS